MLKEKLEKRFKRSDEEKKKKRNGSLRRFD